MALKSQTEIRRLFKRGKKISGKCCSLIWEAGDSFRYGVFVSKKHGAATKRNHLKRLYREAIRLNRHLLSGPVIIGALPDAETRLPAFAEINAEIQRIFTVINANQR